MHLGSILKLFHNMSKFLPDIEKLLTGECAGILIYWGLAQGYKNEYEL